MKYMLLIYVDPQAAPEGGTPEAGAEGQAYGTYTQELVGAGAMVSGDPLHGNETATTVRVRDGETLTSDGPFAETKEQLLGFYVIDCEDLDAALETARELAAANPGPGSYEIRPLLLFRPGPGLPATAP